MASTRQAEKPHKARKLVDIAQKARGRTPLKYELEVIPFFAGELPSGLEKVSFAWERGTKLFMTDAEAVNPHTRAVFWKQYLKQTATLYKENDRLLPKEYSFKIQHVRGSGDGASRKTIGKIKIDMSQFCSGDTAPIPQEVFLQLKPAGKLKVSVKATWLKDAKVDMDALTEASFTTHRSNDGAGLEGEDEQDLSGFDHLDPHPGQPHHHHSRTHSQDPGQRGSGSGSGSGGSSGSIAAQLAAKQQRGLAETSSNSSQASSSPKIAAGAYKPHLKVSGAIPAFHAGLSPEEERASLEQEKARQAAFQQAEVDKMRRTIEDQLRAELNDALAAHSKSSWRDVFCCCWPRKAVRVRTSQEMAVRDESERTLLAAQGAYL